VLVVDDLYVHYGKIRALRGVSIQVNQGETVGVIGPNGAGKSTLLLAIMGVRKPVSGKIVFEGDALTGASPGKVVRKGIGLVPEGRRILSTLTVEENLRLPGSIRKDRDDFKRDFERVLRRFPILERYRRSLAGTLSGGEQQQLAIARALLGRPRLLLLDEPSLGLAPQMVEAVFDELDQLRNEGVTILLVEQNALRTAEFSDRTYVLRSGEIRMSGDRADLEQHAELETAYFGTGSGRA
jgi:branched-chain amino acid transport system ATP-binding protein